jgi:hypothetical protein
VGVRVTVGVGVRVGVGVILIIFFLPTGEKMMIKEAKKITKREKGKK